MVKEVGKLIPRTIFETIVDDLIVMEEAKEEILSVFSHAVEERHMVEQTIAHYIVKTESFLADVTVDEKNAIEPVDLSFVLVGSTVEVVEGTSGEINSFKISHPFSKTFTLNSTSYISPVGLGLLSQRIGDTVVIKTPGGSLNFYITKIQMSACA